jgi:hypothetical protein
VATDREAFNVNSSGETRVTQPPIASIRESLAFLPLTSPLAYYTAATATATVGYYKRSRDSSVGTTTGYWLDGLDSRHRKSFLFSTASGPDLGPIQPPVQWILGAGVFPRGVKRPGRETDHSPPSSAEVKKGGTIRPIIHMSSWHSA